MKRNRAVVGSAWNADRVRGLERYATALAAELAAANAGDVDALADHGEARAAIAAEMDRAGDPRRDEPGDATPRDVAATAAFELVLRRCAAMDASLRERLRELRDETAAELRELERRERIARRYLDGPGLAGRVDRHL